MAARLSEAVQTSVADTAVLIAAARTSRKAIIIQNVGAAPMRVSASANVTATTGMRLSAGEGFALDGDDCPLDAIYAIRDGSVSTTSCVTEVLD